MTTDADSRTPELQEVLRVAVEYYTRDINVALPGRIDNWDPVKQLADVKPLVQRLVADADGEETAEILPVIPGVPVVFPRAGGFYASLPVKKGDFCLLVFCNFPIDVFKSGNGDDASPNDFSTHELTDAVALMGFSPVAQAIKDVDPDNMVMGKEKGVQVHIASDKIELGQKEAAEQLSVDSKVQNELNRLQGNVDALRSTVDTLISLYNAHIHVTTATVGATPTPGVISPTTSVATPPAPIEAIEATNSTLVTIKE